MHAACASQMCAPCCLQSRAPPLDRTRLARSLARRNRAWPRLQRLHYRHHLPTRCSGQVPAVHAPIYGGPRVSLSMRRLRTSSEPTIPRCGACSNVQVLAVHQLVLRCAFDVRARHLNGASRGAPGSALFVCLKHARHTLPTFTDSKCMRRMQGPPHVSSTKPLQAFERFCWTSGCPRPTVRVRAVLWCGTHSAHGCVVYSTPHSWHGKHAAAARGWQLAARLYPSRVPMQIRGSRAKEVSLRALPCLRCDCLLVPHSQWPVGGEESLRGGFLAGLGIYLARVRAVFGDG